MQILFVCQEYPPAARPGGIGGYVECMAAALASRGHQVHVLSCEFRQKKSDSVERGVQVHRRPLLPLRYLHRLLPQTLTRLRVAASNYYWFKRLETSFDVVEYPEWMAEGLFFSLLRPSATVAELHTPLSILGKHFGYRANLDFKLGCLMEKCGVRRADKVSSPSQLLVDELAGSGWLQGRLPEVIPYPIEGERWGTSVPVSLTEPRLLFIGRLERRKSPETVVEAVNILKPEFPQLHASFAGCGNGTREGLPYDEWVKKLAGPGNGCEFLGVVPRDQLPSLISKARVVVLPATFDNFPVTVLEALASGRPVVVSTKTGMASLVCDNGAGKAVPVGDPAAMAAAVRPYLADASYAARAGEQARNLVRNFFDPDHVAGQRELLYRQAHAEFKAREGRN